MNTAVNLLKDILIFIIDALIWLIALVKSAALAIWDWLLSVPLSEKIIVFTFIPSFFAVAMPAARFPIFETSFEVTNPLAVYLIGIALLMLLTSFYRGRIALALRIGVNIAYLAAVIWIHASGTITMARPYSMTFFFYLNYAAPILFLTGTILSRFVYFRE